MKYCDEKDKCYGVVGMAIGLNVWEAEDFYTGIDLDAHGYDCISFTGDYFFCGTPSISPKISWQHQLKVFKIMMGITISNVMCRSIIGKNEEVNRKDKRELLDIFNDQGNRELSLTNSECEAIFNKAYNYLERLYNHDQVRQMVYDFAEMLKEKRKITSCEVAEALYLLNQ